MRRLVRAWKCEHSHSSKERTPRRSAPGPTGQTSDKSRPRCMSNSLHSSPHPRVRREFAPRIGRALEYVASRFDDPSLDLRQVARAVRLSTFHLSRLIKQTTGVGFASHLRALRVERAQQLLQSADLSVKEVAVSVGYANTNALDRNFKTIVGVTPSVYRRQLPTRREAGETLDTRPGIDDEPQPPTGCD
jgi:transcriptional regulator GlxA family with amidase domain